MSSIKLFTPDHSALVSRPLDGYVLPTTDLFLLNILIELRAQTELMYEQAASAIDLDALRRDQTSTP